MAMDQSKTPSITLPNYVKKNLISLKPMIADYEDCDDIIAKHLGDEILEEVKQKWTNSKNVTDPILKTSHLSSFLSDFPAPATDENIEDIALAYIFLVLADEEEDIHVPKMEKSEFYSLPLPKSSAGNNPLDRREGKISGSKRELYKAAIDMIDDKGIYGSEYAPKGEVLKIGKKIRATIIEPFVMYLRKSYMFSQRVKRHGKITDADLTGLSRTKGGFLKILYYFATATQLSGESMEEAFNRILDDMMDEMDVIGWDLSQNRQTTLPYYMYMYHALSYNMDDVDKIIHTLSHDLCPFVRKGGNEFGVAPYKMMSGQYFTLDGNTKIHDSITKVAIFRLIEEEEVNEAELRRISSYVVLGDDKLQLASPLNGKIKNKLEKHYGLKFTQKEGPLHEVEILRTKFKKVGSSVVTFREPVRVLAKWYHGAARNDPATSMQALTSASLEIGYDPTFNAMLHEIAERVKPQEDVIIDKDDYVLKGHGLVYGDIAYPMSLGEVLVRQQGYVNNQIDIQNNYYG